MTVSEHHRNTTMSDEQAVASSIEIPYDAEEKMVRTSALTVNAIDGNNNNEVATTTDPSVLTYRGSKLSKTRMTASVLLRTGGGTIVDPQQAIRDSTRSRQDGSQHDPDLHTSSDGAVMVPGTGRITREHMVKLLRDSKRFEHVTEEQIDRVRVIHDRFLEGASFSFNYNTLLFVASVLAGLGLVSNSVATIIASMLVSPLMGPVIGMAYGMTIMDRNLVKRAFVTEIISLITCLVVGCLLCLVTGPTALAENWPTQEMLARGSWQNFFVACPVAFFSGLGVAVAVMDDQMSSLVGVAISASLLPPAVNAGIMWVAHGFVQSNILVPAASETFAPTAAPIVEVDNATSRFLALSDNTDLPEGEEQYELKKYLEFGGISMAITIANIVLIIVSSILMFRLKEVLPIKKSVFWEDLRIARKIYQKRAVMALNYPSQSVISGRDAGEDSVVRNNGVYKESNPVEQSDAAVVPMDDESAP